MQRKNHLIHVGLAITLAVVVLTAGFTSGGRDPDAPQGWETNEDGERGRWDDLGEDGRVWVPFEPPAAPVLPPSDLGAYHNYDEMVEVLEELAHERPGMFTLLPIGTSVQGRVLYLMRIVAPGAPLLDRSFLLFDGAHHGNEVIGSETLIRFLMQVHERYDEDVGMQEALEQVVIDVVPMVNPDGVMRASSCVNYATCRKNTNGVDLNRNYRDHWGGPGSSNNPTSPVYHGPAPLSEPESQAIARLLDATPYTLHATFHSGAEVILWPYGWTTSPPPDVAVFQALGAALSQVTGGVPHGQTARVLYLASGTTMDQAYGSALLWRPLSFTPEAYRGSGNAFDWWRLFNPAETEASVQATVDKWLPFIWYLTEQAPTYQPPLVPVPSTFGLPAPLEFVAAP
jgi:hypothetical protein